MKILALETAGTAGSVAAFAGAQLLAEHVLSPHQRSAQSLAPAIAQVLAAADWDPRRIELIAVTVGPGSFTGLRVGVTAAKLLAYAAGAGVLGIDTLEAIAAAAPADVDRLSTAVDAQRGQVAARSFRRDPGGFFTPEGPEQLIDTEAWFQQSLEMPLAGPVLAKLAARLPAGGRVLDRGYWFPTARVVGQLALRQYASGRRGDPWTLRPHYSRRAAAEEKREDAAG